MKPNYKCPAWPCLTCGLGGTSLLGVLCYRSLPLWWLQGHSLLPVLETWLEAHSVPVVCRIKLVHSFFMKQWEIDKHQAQWMCKSLLTVSNCVCFSSKLSQVVASNTTLVHMEQGESWECGKWGGSGQLREPTAMWMLGRNQKPTALEKVYWKQPCCPRIWI